MSTLLWALNSKCNFHCKYCYLDFDKDKNPINNRNTVGIQKISDKKIFKFIGELKRYNINRVFLAGAEPLLDIISILSIIKAIKKEGIQVVLCTNGYLIEKYYKEIIVSHLDAISISLDSYNKKYNNTYRGYPTNDGFEKVINGIKIIKEKSKIKVGVYSVLTKKNLEDLEKTYKFVSNLYCDYFIYQPVFLNENSKLYKELVIDKKDINKFKIIIEKLYNIKSNTLLPNKEYSNKIIQSILRKEKCIKECFAGRDLFFITPDGSIHACPSSKKIPYEKEKIKIDELNLEKVFLEKKLAVSECYDFSEDCVNMWQLMAFNEIL